MAVIGVPIERDSVLREMAFESAKKHPDNQDAAREVINGIKSDPPMHKKLSGELMQLAVDSLINIARSELRQSLKVSASRFRGCESIAAVSHVRDKANIEAFLDRWTIGGKKLGDMTGNELAPIEVQERLTASGHIQNACFYHMLITKAGNRKIREVISSEHAAELFAEISRQTQNI